MIKICSSNEEDYSELLYGTVYRIIMELTITPKDRENNLVIIEFCYNLKLKNSYGFYNIYFTKNKEVPFSCLCIKDKNLKLEVNEEFGKQEFTSESDSELFTFCQDRVLFALRDIRVKLDIKKELSQNLLSHFSEEEIKLINFSLNEKTIEPTNENLIFHKAIHRLKNQKDYIKIYDVIFCPFPEDKPGRGGEDGEEAVIIKKFKINNVLLNNTAEEEGNGKEGVYGTYYSAENYKSFNYDFRVNFGLFELDCESNSNLNYFQLYVGNLIDYFNLDYLSSFRYEIELNGHSIKFSNKNFKYEVKNDKIVFQGYLDKYNEEKFIELGKQENENFDINNIDKEDRDSEWKSMRINDLIPFSMELDGLEEAAGEEMAEEYDEE